MSLIKQETVEQHTNCNIEFMEHSSLELYVGYDFEMLQRV